MQEKILNQDNIISAVSPCSTSNSKIWKNWKLFYIYKDIVSKREFMSRVAQYIFYDKYLGTIR